MVAEADQEGSGLGWRPVLLVAIFGGMWFLWKRPPAPPPPPAPPAPAQGDEAVWKPISSFYLPACGKSVSEVSGRAEPMLRRLGGDQYEMQWPNPSGGPPIGFRYNERNGVMMPLNAGTQKLLMPGGSCR